MPGKLLAEEETSGGNGTLPGTRGRAEEGRSGHPPAGTQAIGQTRAPSGHASRVDSFAAAGVEGGTAEKITGGPVQMIKAAELRVGNKVFYKPWDNKIAACHVPADKKGKPMNIKCLFLGHDLINMQCQRCGRLYGIPEGYIEDFARAHGYIKPVSKSEYPRCEDAVLFSVPGAGYVAISQNAHNLTGQTVGFSFEVSWGSHGYVGGVMGRTQAIRMAEFILKTCEGITETELQEYFRREKERSAYMAKLLSEASKCHNQTL